MSLHGLICSIWVSFAVAAGFGAVMFLLRQILFHFPIFFFFKASVNPQGAPGTVSPAGRALPWQQGSACPAVGQSPRSKKEVCQQPWSFRLQGGHKGVSRGSSEPREKKNQNFCAIIFPACRRLSSSAEELRAVCEVVSVG